MKRLLILILALFCFVGCEEVEEVEAEVFVIEAEDRLIYESAIEETLNSFYWYYDKDSLEYFDGVIPSGENLLSASEKSGFDMSDMVGDRAVIYTAKLNHFNGGDGGTVYFYFVEKEVAGVYYVPAVNNDVALSLGERNAFATGFQVETIESDSEYNGFKEFTIYNKPAGFASAYTNENNQTFIVGIENERVVVHMFSNNNFIVYSYKANFGEGLKPLSASFLPDGSVGIILGSSIELTGYATTYVSEKVIFASAELGILQNEIELEKGTYSCVGMAEDKMILINDRELEEYELKEDVWELSNSYSISVHGNDFNASDINGDGKLEYLITDYKDFFILDKEGLSLNTMWRTNISIDSFYGYIYVGDLNKDGAKEIYLADSTGTTIRYTIGEHGLVSRNEDISYGDGFYVADFNDDGIDDYIKIRGTESAATLYMGE